MLEQCRQFRSLLEGQDCLSVHLRKGSGKGFRLIAAKPLPRQKSSVATVEFPVGRHPRANGKVPGLSKEFGRVAVLPRQSQAHFRRDDGAQEGSSKHSIHGMIRVLMVGGRDKLGTGQALVGVADGKEFLRRNCVPGQGKGKDEEEQWLHFHFVPDLPMLFQFEEGFKDLSAMNAPRIYMEFLPKTPQALP
jgi:hypothetical protein